jgi:hypothetical protein
MDDSNALRRRAARLFALALKAREEGLSSAEELERLANETLARADEAERGDSGPSGHLLPRAGCKAV